MSKIINRVKFLENLKKTRHLDLIKVVTGVRRCGKSTLFNLYIDFLKTDGVKSEQIVHIKLTSKEYGHLLNDKALYDYCIEKMYKGGYTYFFIDEVQECENWEKAIESLYIMENVDVHITGSNAHMLSSELATLLSGRCVEIEMLPFSFKEYCEITESKDARLAFRNFINFGSFPVVSTMDNDMELIDQYLEGVYNTIIISDVIKRKGVSDPTLLKNIVKYLCSTVGSKISTANITDYINKSGRKITQKTVDKYVKALTDSYLFYLAERYNIKGKNLLKTLGKFYVVDSGMRNHLLAAENTDLGHQLENIVYLELLRRGYRVNVGKIDDLEIDFVATKANTKEYYQVALSVADKSVLDRELLPLQKSSDNYPKFLITNDELTGNYEGIKHINVIEWLLSESK